MFPMGPTGFDQDTTPRLSLLAQLFQMLFDEARANREGEPVP